MGSIRQYETYPIYVNRLSGQVNVFFEHNDNDNDDIDESTYTRFQGGYDKSYGHQWIIGGQVDYLRGHDDYINHGFGKDHVFALGAYATKLLGDTTFTIGAMTVHQSPINSVSGKLGVEIGRTIGTGNLYARFDVHHAFTGNVTTQYNHTTTQADIKGT